VMAMLGGRAKVETNPLAVPADVPMKRQSKRQGSPGAHGIGNAEAPSAQTSDSTRVSLTLMGSEGGFRTPDPAVNSRLLYH
jgi:hypothetical protein